MESEVLRWFLRPKDLPELGGTRGSITRESELASE